MKKIRYENKNIIGPKEPKNIKKNLLPQKISTNQHLLKKENRIFLSRLNFPEQNYSSIQNNNNDTLPKSKLNLNLHPIKKTRSKNEQQINGFSLFLKGDTNFISTKNEVNLITTQYNNGNNQLLIYKYSKDFSSNKIKASMNNMMNNMVSNAINIDNEEKLKNNLNLGQPKRNKILNDLKNRKKITNELKDIKEIRETIFENNFNNTNINNNLNKKLPELLKKKNSINLIDYFNIPPRNKLITPLLQNKNNNNLIRKKSEIILHKIKREKEKEKNLEKNKEIIDIKDIVFGHKIHWKKINLIKEGENSFIYKAFNTSNGQVFIVKEYKRNYMKLFYREVKYLKKNKHKNIVGFIDAEVVNSDNNSNINYCYIYLNYIGGYNLKEFYSKVGFFTKQLLKKLIEQIISFIDYIKLKNLFYNNFNFNHIIFDLDGNIKFIDFSKVESQHDMIKINFMRHGEDLDFVSFKKMIINIISYEKNNAINNPEFSNDVVGFCSFLEATLININTFSEFKNNYFFKENKDKEESIFFKNSSINPSLDLIKNSI